MQEYTLSQWLMEPENSHWMKVLRLFGPGLDSRSSKTSCAQKPSLADGVVAGAYSTGRTGEAKKQICRSRSGPKYPPFPCTR